MEIGIFADKLNVDRGGSNFSLDLLARKLTDRNHGVTVVTVNFGHENKFPIDYPYRIVEMPIENRSRIGDAKEIYRTMKYFSEEFDVYHIFNPALLPIAGWFRKRHNIPVVGRLNNYDIFCTNLTLMDGDCHRSCTLSQKIRHSEGPLTNTITNIPKYTFDTAILPSSINEVDRLFALSPQVKSIYGGIGVEKDRFSIIPNYYDPSFFRSKMLDQPFTDEISIMYVGTLRKHKGVEQLVKSASNLPDNIGIEIVGTGNERESLERLANKNEVNDKVTFHGWVDHDNLPTYYDAADIFVHPGHWPEPFNRTLLEAMQYNCAMVVSEIGAPPWVVGESGVTFKPGDVDDLTHKLNNLIKNNDQRMTLQKNCSERLSNYTPEKVIAKIEKEYESII